MPTKFCLRMFVLCSSSCCNVCSGMYPTSFSCMCCPLHWWRVHFNDILCRKQRKLSALRFGHFHWQGHCENCPFHHCHCLIEINFSLGKPVVQSPNGIPCPVDESMPFSKEGKSVLLFFTDDQQHMMILPNSGTHSPNWTHKQGTSTAAELSFFWSRTRKLLKIFFQA